MDFSLQYEYNALGEVGQALKFVKIFVGSCCSLAS
jgi:hypothetical protein